jgi:hypothetical protein
LFTHRDIPVYSISRQRQITSECLRRPGPFFGLILSRLPFCLIYSLISSLDQLRLNTTVLFITRQSFDSSCALATCYSLPSSHPQLCFLPSLVLLPNRHPHHHQNPKCGRCASLATGSAGTNHLDVPCASTPTPNFRISQFELSSLSCAVL